MITLVSLTAFVRELDPRARNGAAEKKPVSARPLHWASTLGQAAGRGGFLAERDGRIERGGVAHSGRVSGSGASGFRSMTIAPSAFIVAGRL